jgi:hypothetical protein
MKHQPWPIKGTLEKLEVTPKSLRSREERLERVRDFSKKSMKNTV